VDKIYPVVVSYNEGQPFTEEGNPGKSSLLYGMGSSGVLVLEKKSRRLYQLRFPYSPKSGSEKLGTKLGTGTFLRWNVAHRSIAMALIGHSSTWQ